ncbi:hypothetical protein C8R46DRAFT_1234623 [Mycena filopes]|nr:hypothetical protein C8R46DRAFT_1234623 [Mycena filopes]
MQKQTKKYPKERPGTCQRKIIYTRSRTGLTRRVIAWGLELGHWSRKRTFLMSRCRSKHAEAGGSRSVTPHESLGTSQSLTRSANATSIEESSSVEGHVYQFALETVDLVRLYPRRNMRPSPRHKYHCSNMNRE